MTLPRLLLPVKRLDRAKSRLGLAPSTRHDIARSLLEHALRTTSACVGPERVTLVTADPEVQRMARSCGVRSLHDPHDELNAALEAALSQLRGERPAETIVVSVVDLPRLNTTDLARVLRSMTANTATPCHVPDLSGTGTTMVSIPPASGLPMLFGAQSAMRFRAAGCRSVTDAPDSVRADVDTIADLVEHGGRQLRSLSSEWTVTSGRATGSTFARVEQVSSG